MDLDPEHGGPGRGTGTGKYAVRIEILRFPLPMMPSGRLFLRAADLASHLTGGTTGRAHRPARTAAGVDGGFGPGRRPGQELRDCRGSSKDEWAPAEDRSAVKDRTPGKRYGAAHQARYESSETWYAPLLPVDGRLADRNPVHGLVTGTRSATVENPNDIRRARRHGNRTGVSRDPIPDGVTNFRGGALRLPLVGDGTDTSSLDIPRPTSPPEGIPGGFFCAALEVMGVMMVRRTTRFPNRMVSRETPLSPAADRRAGLRPGPGP